MVPALLIICSSPNFVTCAPGLLASSCDVCLSLLQSLFEHVEPLVYILISGHKGNVQTDHVIVETRLQEDQAAPMTGLQDLDSQLGSRFLGRAVLDKFECQHGSQATHLANTGETPLHLLEAQTCHLCNGHRSLQQLVLLEDVQYRKSRSASHRVAAIGAPQGTRHGSVHDVCPSNHPTEWQARRDRLPDQEQIGHDSVMLDGKHLACPTISCLDLVCHEQNLVVVADLAQLMKKPWRGDHEAALSLHRFHNQGGDPFRGHLGAEQVRSEEHTSELQSPYDLVCRLLLETKNYYS